MKRLLILLFFVPLVNRAQNKPLVIEGIAPALYVTHTVAPKENYYSIGRAYNISPKEIAPFNGLALESGLSLNQVIKIPLTPGNFLQNGNAAPDEALVPLYHTVAGKEGLYRVSVNYNKVPIESIRQWNNLKGEAVGNGARLIVGYLKVKKDLSPLAAMAKSKPVDNEPAPGNSEKAAAQKETSKPATTPQATAPPITQKPEPVKEPAVSTPVANVEKETKDPLPVTQKVDPPKETKEAAPVTQKISTEPAPEPTEKKEEAKKVITKTSRRSFDGGLFKPAYEMQTQSKDIAGEKGEGAVFKSTSGWDDGKYYCLHNSAAPGTIIKITNNANGKSIYAKVLDIIPDIKQNNGLLVRVSNAAADELGAASDGKFDCSISYSK